VFRLSRAVFLPDLAGYANLADKLSPFQAVNSKGARHA